MEDRLKFGRWGEKLAEEFLQTQGINIIARNVRTEYGEIDLIGKQGAMTLFIEVKTRRSLAFGLPEDAVTRKKLDHIYQSAQAFLQENQQLGEDWRIDVIAIYTKAGKETPEIEWFENVLE